MGCCGTKMDTEKAEAAAAEARAAPLVLTKEQQAAKRAAQLERLAALPEHLRLGMTLPGMHDPDRNPKQARSFVPRCAFVVVSDANPNPSPNPNRYPDPNPHRNPNPSPTLAL